MKKVVQLPDSVLNRYLGTYKVEKDTLLISQNGKDLVLGVKGTPIQWKLHFTSPTDFYIEELRGDLKALQASDGKIEGMILNQGNASAKIVRLQ
jgi:hypothetical protein